MFCLERIPFSSFLNLKEKNIVKIWTLYFLYQKFQMGHLYARSTEQAVKAKHVHWFFQSFYLPVLFYVYYPDFILEGLIVTFLLYIRSAMTDFNASTQTTTQDRTHSPPERVHQKQLKSSIVKCVQLFGDNSLGSSPSLKENMIKNCKSDYRKIWINIYWERLKWRKSISRKIISKNVLMSHSLLFSFKLKVWLHHQMNHFQWQ